MRPFEQIVSEYGATVLRICRATLGSTDAEDAWSETFLSALKAYPQLSRDTNVEAWLVTIARRRAIDLLRARARSPLPMDQVPERPDPAAHPADRDEELWQALAQLPAKQRLAVSYHYVGGLPYQEVATIVGGTVEAARRAASDGIKGLRTLCPQSGIGAMIGEETP